MMNDTLMILPASDPGSIRLVRVPADYQEDEAFRYVANLMTRLEEEDPMLAGDDVVAVLEDYGFEVLDFILGPSLD
jgi:hypothetical protein